MIRDDNTDALAGGGTVAGVAGEGGGTAEEILSPARAPLLRAIIETSPDGLIAIDASGCIRLFNPAAERMFGYPARDVLGANVSCLMPSPDRERHDGYIARYLRTGERRIIGRGREVLACHAQGHTFPVELAVGEVRMAESPLFTAFVRDISGRKQAEQQLAELQSELLHVTRLSAMGAMASALAHELNQPLTAIMAYAQTAGRASASNAGRQGELLDKIVQQASRAGQIIRGLRRFLGKGESEHTLASLNQVVQEAGALALIGTASRGVEVRFQLAEGLPPVLVDRVQIHQVVTNLIRNSVDALAGCARRELLIATGRLGAGEVEIVVADTGPGLAHEVAARLFQPFVTTKPGGMGIGLSICRTIVDAHGGRIWASPRPGGGTAFHVALPVARRDNGKRSGG